MISGEKRDDVKGLLAENESLKSKVAELTATLDETIAKIEAQEAITHAELVESLLAQFASESQERALDVAKLYAAATGSG